MIDNNYNEKFRKFFKKFELQYKNCSSNEEKDFLWNLAIDFIEKNRDFIMQYPLIQYWEKVNLDEQNYKELEKTFLEEYKNKKVNLYFHIPFCKSKCSYCNFTIVTWKNKKELLSNIYIKKLKDEVDFFVKNVWNFKINTIFIWWGTPSYLNEKDLESFLKYIKEKLNNYFQENTEYCFEWNPDSFNKEKLEILKKYWINRLSLWVQTFNNEILKNTNRTYSDKDIKNTIQLFKEIWFDNINIDMLYWLPGQTIEKMQKDLDIVKNLDIEHITYYPLYNYDNSILWQTNAKVNNIKDIYNFYDKITKTLKENNFNQYWREYFCKNNKISNYQKNFLSNKYLYWFWLSANSFNKKYVFRKEENLKEYTEKKATISHFFKYKNDSYDKRLFILWSRHKKIYKKNIKNRSFSFQREKLTKNNT